ncbi:MAG: Ig-like domain-containing protein, partial [Mycobacteriaceae bacterium]
MPAAAVMRPVARVAANPAAGLLPSLAALFNNRTPKLYPTQSAQSPAGVVSGRLNAVDPDSPRLTFTVTVAPANGTAAVGADGSWTYTPDPPMASAGGIDSFRVTVSDAASGFAVHGLAGLLHMLSFGLFGSRSDSSTATVTVTVAPIATGNNPPTGTAVVGSPGVTGVVNGSVSATDADGDTLTYSAPATTAKGSIGINATAGSFAYTPTPVARHTAALLSATAAQRADTFPVTVSDGRGGTAAVPVSVTIGAANVAPVAGAPTVGIPDSGTGVVNGSVSATDADGDTLTYS